MWLEWAVAMNLVYVTPSHIIFIVVYINSTIDKDSIIMPENIPTILEQWLFEVFKLKYYENKGVGLAKYSN